MIKGESRCIGFALDLFREVLHDLCGTIAVGDKGPEDKAEIILIGQQQGSHIGAPFGNRVHRQVADAIDHRRDLLLLLLREVSLCLESISNRLKGVVHARARLLDRLRADRGGTVVEGGGIWANHG